MEPPSSCKRPSSQCCPPPCLCSPPSPEEEEEEDGVLREYLQRLQAEQAAVEVSLLELGCPGPPGAMTRPSDAIRAKVEQAVQASLAALPGERPRPKLDKTQLLQELAALQVGRQVMGSGASTVAGVPDTWVVFWARVGG